MTTFNSKRNALLGGLLVFMVPIVAISVVYFTASRLPKGKEIPLVKHADTIGDWYYLNGADTIRSGTFGNDIKVLFHVDSTNIEARVALLDKITESTKTHAPYTRKDPYGQLYFIAVNEMENSTYPQDLNHWFFVNELNGAEAFSDKNRLYLLDRDENIRGEYLFTQAQVDSIDIDIQYLLQDTYYVNADSLRIRKLFPTRVSEK